MESSNNPCIENKKIRPVLKQLFITGACSLIGMCLMALIIEVFFFEPNEDISYGFWDDFLFMCLINILWFNNINVFFLIILHYTKFFSYFIYSSYVIIEGMLFFLFLYFLLIVIGGSTVNYVTAPIITIIILILIISSSKYLFKHKYEFFENKFNKIEKLYKTNRTYVFGRKIDFILSLIIPTIPLIVIIFIC